MKLNFHPNSPHSIERTLLKQGIREPGATNTFKNILKQLNSEYDEIHVFDVGANVGYFALLEASILNNSIIYAIEAEPNNVQRLRTNIEINNYDNVEIIPYAVGAKRENKEMAISSSSNTHRMSGVVGDKEYKELIDVEVHPLDQIVSDKNIPQESLIIVRMDVEGYEMKVIEGMTELLDSNRRMLILLEIHTRLVNVDEIINMIKKNGFSPEYFSADGGDTYENLDNFDEIKKVESTSHLVASRF